MQYLLQAAENGHRAAMIEMARALDTGTEREEGDDATGPTTDTKYTTIYMYVHVIAKKNSLM